MHSKKPANNKEKEKVVEKKDKEQEQDDLLNMEFEGTYKIDSKISEGSFGVVYLAHELKKNIKVAIKVEKRNALIKDNLFHESQIMKRIQGLDGVPAFYLYGKKFMYIYLVLELLGSDLYRFFKKYRRFSLKTVCIIAFQMLNILDSIHTKGVVHRDLKPENIVIGLNEKKTHIYLIDYGISKEYKENGRHIAYREGKPFIGTVRFASIAAHKGVEISRKDDLESLGYLLIYFMKGKLPWQNKTKMTEADRRKMVSDLKQNIKDEDLCVALPITFSVYIKYVKNLSFKETPNYNYLITLFSDLAKEMNLDLNDGYWDWSLKKFEPKKKEEIQKEKEDVKEIDKEEQKKYLTEQKDNNNNKIEFWNTFPIETGDDRKIDALTKIQQIIFKNPFIKECRFCSSPGKAISPFNLIVNSSNNLVIEDNLSSQKKYNNVSDYLDPLNFGISESSHLISGLEIKGTDCQLDSFFDENASSMDLKEQSKESINHKIKNLEKEFSFLKFGDSL